MGDGAGHQEGVSRVSDGRHRAAGFSVRRGSGERNSPQWSGASRQLALGSSQAWAGDQGQAGLCSSVTAPQATSPLDKGHMASEWCVPCRARATGPGATWGGPAQNGTPRHRAEGLSEVRQREPCGWASPRRPTPDSESPARPDPAGQGSPSPSVPLCPSCRDPNTPSGMPTAPAPLHHSLSRGRPVEHSLATTAGTLDPRPLWLPFQVTRPLARHSLGEPKPPALSPAQRSPQGLEAKQRPQLWVQSRDGS